MTVQVEGEVAAHRGDFKTGGGPRGRKDAVERFRTGPQGGALALAATRPQRFRNAIRGEAMRSGPFLSAWSLALALLAGAAMAQSPAPAEPGRSATEGVTSPATPPARVAPTESASGAPAEGVTRAEIRELIDAAQATAKATREMVDYNRVTPDILTQILAKLDKLEDKLDRVEAAVRAGGARRR